MIGLVEAAAKRSVPRETMERLKAYVALLTEEASRQNLVARSSLPTVWERHIADSAQLLRFEPHAGATWVDIGSGAGLPGIVVACIIQGSVTLVEPRRLRADFLRRVCTALGLRAEVVCGKAERLFGSFDVITARAVAPLGKLLEISQHLSTRKTVWALPRGKSGLVELAEAQRTWHGTFHVERSVTGADSFVIVGTDVRPKP